MLTGIPDRSFARRHIMIRYTIFATLLLALAAPSGATPLDGDLFGYRLGDRYPVSASTYGRRGVMGGFELTAEKPTKPAGFKEVGMVVTSKTYTIANIYGTAQFPSPARANAFAAKYRDLLTTLYGKSCTPLQAYLGETLKMLCAGKYELSVWPHTVDKPSKIYEVTVGLRMGTDKPDVDPMTDQFRAEEAELRAEWAQRRVDAAAKSQQLDGLQ